MQSWLQVAVMETYGGRAVRYIIELVCVCMGWATIGIRGIAQNRVFHDSWERSEHYVDCTLSISGANSDNFVLIFNLKFLFRFAF